MSDPLTTLERLLAPILAVAAGVAYFSLLMGVGRVLDSASRFADAVQCRLAATWLDVPVRDAATCVAVGIADGMSGFQRWLDTARFGSDVTIGDFLHALFVTGIVIGLSVALLAPLWGLFVLASNWAKVIVDHIRQRRS